MFQNVESVDVKIAIQGISAGRKVAAFFVGKLSGRGIDDPHH
jgi:hypothetical protein